MTSEYMAQRPKDHLYTFGPFKTGNRLILHDFAGFVPSLNVHRTSGCM